MQVNMQSLSLPHVTHKSAQRKMNSGQESFTMPEIHHFWNLVTGKVA